MWLLPHFFRNPGHNNYHFGGTMLPLLTMMSIVRSEFFLLLLQLKCCTNSSLIFVLTMTTPPFWKLASHPGRKALCSADDSDQASMESGIKERRKNFKMMQRNYETRKKIENKQSSINRCWKAMSLWRWLVQTLERPSQRWRWSGKFTCRGWFSRDYLILFALIAHFQPHARPSRRKNAKSNASFLIPNLFRRTE